MKKMIITGNIGKDPELRLDTSGKQYATFSIAVSVGTKENPKIDWVDASFNGKLAEIAVALLKKGTKVLVEGFPSVKAYINKDNIPVGVLRLYANTFEILAHPLVNHVGDDSESYVTDEDGWTK